MSEHHLTLDWRRATSDFNYDTFERTHAIHFSGGTRLEVSSAPDYLGNKAYTNPEELLGAALASCHMLTFLAIAAKSRLVVDHYEDQVTAILEKNAQGQMAVTRIMLKPRVTFSGTSIPGPDKLRALHDKAHQYCFIANSVRSEVSIEPQI